MKLSVADEITLALIVWVIYAGDRLLDGWMMRDQTFLQDRHLFSIQHRGFLTALVVAACAGIFWLVDVNVTLLEARAGLELGAIVAVYILGIHVGRGSLARVVPKEIAVGFLFATGTTLPMWSLGHRFPWDIWFSFFLFALLCCLNCLSIECWENHLSNEAWPVGPHALARWVNCRIDIIAIGLAAVAFMVLLVDRDKKSTEPGLLAISVAALLILVLNQYRQRLLRQALRVLVDATLVLAGLIALLRM